MKFSKIVVAMGLGMSLVCGVANAATSGTVPSDQGHGTVHFHGSIIDAPCSISPDTVDQTVELGSVSNSLLKNGGASSPVAFDISLENCDVSTKNTVTVIWGGEPDTTDTSLLGITGTASGAGIVMKDASGTPVKLGTATKPQTLTNGSNTISMSAYLKGNGATDVVPGEFTSTADFALVYP